MNQEAIYMNPLTDFGFKKIFGKMSNIARLVNMSPADLAKYNISIDECRTNRACVEFERAEGRAEGLLQAARKMLAAGMDKNIVATMLGVDDKEI